MKHCPVCNLEYEAAPCPGCGYDESCHYEAYPTLGPIPSETEAISARKAAQAGIFHCPACGGTHFLVRFAEKEIQCARCGRREPLALQDKANVENAPSSLTRQSVALGDEHTVILRNDGTVFCSLRSHSTKTDTWTDIASVAAGSSTTFGIRKDGTVLFAGTDPWVHTNDWQNITAIAAGYWKTVGLRRDGTVVSTNSSNPIELPYPEMWDKPSYSWTVLDHWKNITAIASGVYFAAGLRSDGTVAAVGTEANVTNEVTHWKNIIKISAGTSHLVGLRKDGTVVSTRLRVDGLFKKHDVSKWTDIVDICAGNDYTIGLRKDGTVVATGNNGDRQCDVRSWRDIIAVYAGAYHTVGIRKDGTLVATGSNRFGQCNLDGLTVCVD